MSFKLMIRSRAALEEMISHDQTSGCAIISFYDPPRPDRADDPCRRPPALDGHCAAYICVPLYDLDPSALHSVGLTTDTYLPQADEIADFICAALDNGLDIICQCEYGQSRSAACAAAILQHTRRRGIDIFADYRYYPNQLVYNKIYRALCRHNARGDRSDGDK